MEEICKRRGDGGGFPVRGMGGNRTGMQKDQRTSGASGCHGLHRIFLCHEAGGCRKNREDSGSFPHHGGPGDIGIVRYLRPDCELRKGKKTKMYAHQGHKCIQRRQKQKESCIMHIKNLNIMHDAIVRIVQF